MTFATADLPPSHGVCPPWADLIGVPFEKKARGPKSFDCFGLVAEMRRRAGLVTPDYIHPADLQVIADAMEAAEPMWTRCKPGKGALIAIRLPLVGGGRVTHVAFQVSPHDFIHTWEGTRSVVKERLSDWTHRIAGFYRYDPQ
jgi:cell wall-associated NlpC family hydrolase